MRVSICKRHDVDRPVQDGLAFTPARMLELAEQGIPVSTQTAASSFDDGYTQLEFEPNLELQRGIDMADLWEAQQNVREKMRNVKIQAKND